MRLSKKIQSVLMTVLITSLSSVQTVIAAVQSSAERASPVTTQQPADPKVWGMFAQLVGKNWAYDEPNYENRRRECRWSVPGKTMVMQEFRNNTLHTQFTVTRAEELGEFTIVFSYLGLSSSRKARLQPDGSVILPRESFMKPAMHFLIKDGRWEEDNVKLDSNGAVVKVNWFNAYRNESPEFMASTESPNISVAEASRVPSQPIIVSVPDEPPTGMALAGTAAPSASPASFDSFSSPKAITVGHAVAGNAASTPGCYQVDIPKGQTLDIRLTSGAFAPTLQVARGALCQGAVPQKEAKGSVGKAAELVFESAGGRYLILVQPTSAGSRGAYNLSVALRETSPPDETASGKPIAENGESAPGAEEDPRVALMRAQVESRHAQLAAEEAQRQEQLRQQREAEARQREQERIERQQAAANRQATFDAFMGGLQTVTSALQESNNDYQEQQRQLANIAAAQRAAQQNQQTQTQAVQAAALRQQQATAREAVARQLVAANAYRARQMASTNDAATLQRLQSDNQKALLAARQIGVEQQVLSGSANAAQEANAAKARERAEQQRLAQQQAERQQRLAQQQAEQQRNEAQARAQQQAEQDQLAREQAAHQQQQRALDNHLAAERRGIRLRALTCPSGQGSYFIAGSRPHVSPQVANCITVHYEARCPGVPSGHGVTGTAYNFVGGDSCLGDTSEIPALSCKADQVIVDVREVSTCK